ncbi:Holliday junction resolvase RuvX [Texcoconibacillus texcoconensis]|uniref:Putative pre-16S rRNA nuclease n=1 Tax=Texcoconibacillus texcoconensis TaxID=1095777 RepID=A0A840QP76_9BACI|nr:Holliday junction resolvase RuvX [Texcoconibacillus texcoconensis]MBB5173175.1 putative Holliday junction resolvase [Texcoconibacillus texcoconensis]
MRVLGLDVGTKTIGVAVSDAFGWTAQGLETIHRDPNHQDQDFERLRTLIDEHEVEKVVVGLPKNMNGTIGERGQACEAFADAVSERLDIDVAMWDERLSTSAAQQTLLEADVSRKKRKKVIDKMAAVFILQGYLDRHQ